VSLTPPAFDAWLEDVKRDATLRILLQWENYSHRTEFPVEAEEVE
jgi:hypothetical protein